MREILFRGKRIDNGKWIEGYYFCSRDLHREYNHKIHPLDSDWSYEIDPSTISEFTGLTDKNGRRVFEGDIIDIYAHGIPGYLVVEYVADIAAYMAIKRNKNGSIVYSTRFKDDDVIFIESNIYDNPELLEVER